MADISFNIRIHKRPGHTDRDIFFASVFTNLFVRPSFQFGLFGALQAVAAIISQEHPSLNSERDGAPWRGGERSGQRVEGTGRSQSPAKTRPYVAHIMLT